MAGIDLAIGRDGGVFEAELFAGVEERRAAEREERDGGRAGARLGAEAGAVAWGVVVGQHPRRPGPDRVEPGRDVGDARTPRGGVPRRRDRRGQIEREVKLVVRAEVALVLRREELENLADEHA